MADDQMLDVVSEFLDESRENLEKAEAELVSLENNPENQELIDSIFRVFHSLKGGAGFMHLDAIAHMTHKLENILTAVKGNKRKVNKEMISLLLRGVDMISNAVERAEQDPKATGPTEEEEKFVAEMVAFHEGFDQTDLLFQGENLLEGLSKLLKEMKEEDIEISKHPLMRAILGSMDSIQSEISLKKKGRDINFDCVYKGKDFGPHVRSIFQAIDKLREHKITDSLINEIQSSLDALSDVFQEEKIGALYEKALAAFKNISMGWKIVEDNLFQEFFDDFYSDYLSALTKVFKPLPSTKDARTTPTGPPPAKPPEKSPEAGEKGGEKKEEKFIRIRQEKLDQFMNQVGELIITKDVFRNVHQKFAESKAGRENLKEHESVIHQLDELSMGMQDSVMEIRKLPVRQLFQRFTRLVREVSGQVNKKIKLEISGDETELDKNLIELLEDPLVHILRNSIDHGIELTAEDRTKAGKPEEGRVSLSARADEEFAYIIVEDDGRGIDTAKIRQLAIKRGIISEEEAEALSENEIQKFIFHAGFSTAEKVTDVSGRGVGMDVVMSNLKKCGGRLDLDSTIGVGSKITIKLPQTLTLVTKDALVVRADGEFFAAPLEDVEAIIKLEQKTVRYHFQNGFFHYKNTVLGLAHLSSLLSGEDFSFSGDNKEEAEEWTVIIVTKGNGEKAAIVVEGVEKNQKIVVRPFDRDYLKAIQGFAGFTVLGDGKVALILDVGGLMG